MILIFLMGVRFILLFGKYPDLGVFVTMFIKVAEVFFKIFLVYLCLILTFTIAMYIAFKPQDDDK